MSNKSENKLRRMTKTTKRPLQKFEPTVPQQYLVQLPQHSIFYVLIASLIISGGVAIGIGGWQAALGIYVLNLTALIWFGKRGG